MALGDFVYFLAVPYPNRSARLPASVLDAASMRKRKKDGESDVSLYCNNYDHAVMPPDRYALQAGWQAKS
jgi:hypothetical protein